MEEKMTKKPCLEDKREDASIPKTEDLRNLFSELGITKGMTVEIKFVGRPEMYRFLVKNRNTDGSVSMEYQKPKECAGMKYTLYNPRVIEKKIRIFHESI